MADEARVNVVLPARGKADDNAHRPRRISLRPRNPRYRRQRGSPGGQMQKLSSVGKFHFEPPSPFRSLDHLVGGDEQLVGHSETEHPGGLSVNANLVTCS